MKLNRCAKGHFYDKEKYAMCPHCNSNVTARTDNSEGRTKAFEDDVVTDPVESDIEPDIDFYFGNEPSERNVTFPVSGLSANTQTVELDPSQAVSVTIPLEDPVSSDNRGSRRDDGHTVGFFDDFLEDDSGMKPLDRPPVQKENKSPVINKVSTPCVGWLIALNGEHVGTDFRLKVGKNFIGRNHQMDIALTEDRSVSRDRHAIVIYEPKACIYMMQPGESSSLVYKNDEVVLSPVNLTAYDKITVGEVDLLFVPLCGEKFNWSDWFEQTKKRGKV